MWRKVINVGLLLALVCSFAAIAGCGQNKKVVQPKLAPLGPPFSEVISSMDDLFFEPYSRNEETIYNLDGTITYSRIYGNKSASYIPSTETEKPETPAVVLVLSIRAYEDEEKAKKHTQKERKKKWFDESTSESNVKLLELSLEDVVASVHFWEESAVQEVQGEEEIFFRIGLYIGHYSVHINNPHQLKDGFIMPSNLHDLLESALIKTNIVILNSL